MKRLMKKTISIVCAVAMLFAGLAFVPQSVSADDVWYDMDNTWPEPHPLLEVPEGETSLWTGCTGGATQIKTANAFQLQGFKWNTVTQGEAAFFKTIDLKKVACVNNGYDIVKPEAGKFYTLHAKIHYTPATGNNTAQMMIETSGGVKDIPLTKWMVRQSASYGDQFEQEVTGIVCMKENTDFKFCINYGWLSNSQKWKMGKGIIEITEFSLVEDTSWVTVPNGDPTYTNGPWNMFGNFIDDPEITGNYGILQYKKTGDNPEYSDYTFRPVSVSGWEAWSVFARLENYLADYYDYGDPYDITLTVNSSQATVPKTDPEALDQLLVVVGADKHYFDLQEGENTLHMTGTYTWDQYDPHEQIMLEMDGLEPGTELKLTNIALTSPNDGWTNVPNKKDTKVGDWTLFAWWNDTHWSKLAYKNNTTGSGIGGIDIKTRRGSGSLSAMASEAILYNHLATAKDTKNRPIANTEDYKIKVTITARGLDSEVTDYGTVRLLANDQAFDFDVKKGANEYDLYELCGKALTYNNTKTDDVTFELDEVVPKSILTISKIEFIGPDDESQEVPNGSAFKPEGTPWTLFAVTNAESEQFGAMRYEITGDPANLSSTKLTLKSVSGWLNARSVRATLNNYLADLEPNHTYKITVKMNIDESGVAAVDKNPAYDKVLRMTVDNKDYDFNVADPATGVQTFEKEFTFTNVSKHVAFDFDQLLKGSKVSFVSVDITDPSAPTTTPEPSTEKPTETTTVEPSTEPTTANPSTEAPTGETVTAAPQTTVAPTTKVKAPGKAKIKKVYKRKLSAKKLKVKLKKVKGAKGYQVAVYKSKKNAKKNKKALVKKYTKKLKVTIKSKKLKGKRKTYVRARAYALDLNGKKVFGKWSAIKKGKLKKTSIYYPYYY